MNTSATFTALELAVFQAVVSENRDFFGENFSYTNVDTLVNATGIESKVLRGVLSSLIKKGVLEVQDNETYQMITLANQEEITEEQIATLLANN